MTWSLALIAAIFVLAGFVKGVIGLGLPTIAVGLLGVIMVPAQAAALLVVPSFVTNIWQLAAGSGIGPLLRRLWLVQVTLFAGTLLGGALLPVDDSGYATQLLGLALVAYALVGLLLPQIAVPRRAEGWLSPVIGLSTGAVTAMTGVFVVPMVPYIQALGLQRDDLVQALGLSFTVATVALTIVLGFHGQLGSSIAAPAGVALIAALAGMWIGQAVRGRINPRAFRLCFFAGMLLLGSHLMLRRLF